jgi:DNA-binding response OmpR family regulator
VVSVLVVDDEVLFARTLAAGLADQGFEVAVVHDGTQAARLGRERSFDVIVLDIMLPGLSGLEVCRALREHNVGTPILMLTARGAATDETTALDTGADDYLRKPFAFPVLVARCRALLRRGERSTWSELTAGDLVLDPARRVARSGGAEIHLSRRETALLMCLMRSPGQVVSKEQILEEVWGGPADHDSNLVEVYIGYLRRKLDLVSRGSAVRTVRGHGYELRG